MNIAIFSGEVSGDLIGGALARELRRRVPEIELWGLGSGAMRDAGVELLADSAAWGAISVTQALEKAPNLFLRVQPMLKRALEVRRPDVVVLIDFGAFNVRAARYCRAHGLKVLYYFPPGSWRREGTKGAELGRITDVLAVPFTWATERFQKLGAHAVWVGHPLLERVKPTMTKAAFAAQFGMEAAHPIIGLLPGSRVAEVTHLMPTLLESARRIAQRVPDAQFAVAVAPSLPPDLVADFLRGDARTQNHLARLKREKAELEASVRDKLERLENELSGQASRQVATVGGIVVPEAALKQEDWARRRSDNLRDRAENNLPPIVLAQNLTYDVMAHSDLLLTCSGTATLEAAVFGTPMVILYRGSKLMEFEYKLRGMKKKLVHIGLPNILANRRIVPELIQDAANPEAIADLAVPLLNDIAIRQQAKTDLAEVRALLGTEGASARTAQLVLELARREQ